MAKAVFDREFHWRRPGAPFGFGAKASPDVQYFPRDFIAAAVAAGAATEIPPFRRQRLDEETDNGRTNHRAV